MDDFERKKKWVLKEKYFFKIFFLRKYFKSF